MSNLLLSLEYTNDDFGVLKTSRKTLLKCKNQIFDKNIPN
jgi:hypothetical protein